MKLVLFSFFPVTLLAMSDSQPGTIPNTPELRPYSTNIVESNYATQNINTQNIRIINITQEEEANFLRSIQAAYERESQNRLQDIESQVQQPPLLRNNSITNRVANNKTLIVSNLITATIGAIMTLVVHFTQDK